MQKLSFIKGLLIAGLFSSLFWMGAYYAFTSGASNSEKIETQKEITKPQKNMEVAVTKASL